MQRQSLSLLVSAAILAVVGCETEGPIDPTANDPTVNLNAAPMLVSEAPLFDFFETGSGISGTATLTRSKDGLWLDIAAENLVAGHAHSIWWVIFDNPHGCKDDGCGLDDLNRRSAQPTLVNGDGFVAAAGVDNPYQAIVHAIVRSHGAAETDPADLAVQISTLNDFCNLPGDVCMNVGVAVFPEAPPPGKP